MKIIHTSEKTILYKRRWIMLGIFDFCAIISFMQFVEYSIIADAVVEYYGVSYEVVNWSGMLLLLLFIPSIFPGVYLINKIGVRKSILLLAAATCVAAWIKVGSVEKDRFWVCLLGQAIVGASQVFACSLPVPIAVRWFGENEVSTACSIGIFGWQVGVAISFAVPPMIVHNTGITETLRYNFYVLNIGAALFCTVVLVVTYLFFEEEPPTPPSLARLKSKEEGKIDFMPSMLRLLKNRSYLLLLMTYGIYIGVFCTIYMLLNQIVLKYYPNSAEDAGRIGLIIVITGMISAVPFGIIIDKFHKFKETTLCTYFGGAASFLILTFTISQGLAVLYAVAILVGIFPTAAFIIGYEVAVEITYPEPECISSGILQILGQVIGIGFTYFYSYLFYNFGDVPANLVTTGLLLLSSILLLFVRFDLKRRKAQTEETPAVNVLNL